MGNPETQATLVQKIQHENKKKQILQHRRKARKMSNTDPTKKLK